jgi:amino acid transporter
MANLASNLKLPEAIGLSLAIISPTIGAAFNITEVVGAAGPAAPLTFAIGTVAMTLVALSFIAFTHRVAHAGSAYAYVAHTFGSRMGFVAGWTLLATYLGFATGFGAMVGSFTAAALKDLGIDIGYGWLAIGGASLLLSWWLTYRDMRLSSRLMLAVEAVAVLGILVLCVAILRQVPPAVQHSMSTWRPTSAFGGWAGLGFGMVFSILCFAGFEGAATLGEETKNPRRNIPIALFSTVLGSGLFFVFIAYCEVVGFGPTGIRELAKSEAPLNDLALRYVSPQMAITLDLLAAGSCFSGVLACLAASARLLFAFGRVGLSPALAAIHPVHGTPSSALSFATLLVVIPFVLWAPFIGASNFYSYVTTIGVLALILVYIGVGGAEVVESWREQRKILLPAIAILSPLLLLWVLYCNVYPVPAYPNNLWLYVTAAWVMFAWVLMRLRPKVTHAPVPVYFRGAEASAAPEPSPGTDAGSAEQPGLSA